MKEITPKEARDILLKYLEDSVGWDNVNSTYNIKAILYLALKEYEI